MCRDRLSSGIYGSDEPDRKEILSWAYSLSFSECSPHGRVAPRIDIHWDGCCLSVVRTEVAREKCGTDDGRKPDVTTSTENRTNPRCVNRARSLKLAK